MSRVYFNGVGGISFNGKFLSFVLDDTYSVKNGGTNKSAVIELITELDAAEGVCKYLLEEISKIKLMEEDQKNNLTKKTDKIGNDTISSRPPVGIKIPMSKHDHSE